MLISFKKAPANRTALLLIALCVGSVTLLHGQAKSSDQLVTISITSLPLSEALDKIASQTGIAFSYNPRKIPVSQKITYQCIAKPLRAVLDDLMTMTGLQYTFLENQIVLRPDKRTGKSEQSMVTLSGNISASENGEALIGATVKIQSLQAGAVSNGYGFYSITVPEGTYEVNWSFVGFKPISKTLELRTSIQEDISLSEEAPLLKEVVVNSPPTNEVAAIQTSKMSLRPKAVTERTSLFGEMDVVKSLESVPGIKLHSDGSTFYYVRGGNRDQNLILIDDAPIFNPSHMLGVFSTIIPDAVNDIGVYKGDMPASLGGRLSSVLAIRTRKGNDQKWEAWGSQGLISTKLGVEGPLKKNSSSFLLTGRISNFEWIFKKANTDIRKFYFYDLNGKVNFKFNPSNRLFLSFYSGSDNYFTSNNGIQWSNNAGTLRWNHLFSDRLFLNTTLSASAYNYFLFTDVASNTSWHSHVSNINLKTDFTYFLRPGNEITYGTAFGGYNFNPGNLQSSNPGNQVPVVSVRNSAEIVLYANHEIQLTPHWGLNYGLRVSSWSDTGASFEFKYDALHNPVDTLFFKKGQRYKTYNNLEPRLTLSYGLGENASIKAGFSRNVQNVHLISNSISPFTSLEVWLPSSVNIRPQTSNQATLGYYRSQPAWGISWVAETFYKRMTNQIDYAAHAETLLNPLLEGQLRFGEATAYGFEWLLKKEEGRLRGWTGYSYSRAKRKFSDINNGQTYNAFYDRPHQINLVLSYDVSLRWNIGLNWIFTTGAPYSTPTSFYRFNGLEIPVYGQKNNSRLPDYHRMDLSATWKLNKNPEKKFRHSLTFSIFNVYGRKNALFVNFNKTETTTGTFRIPTNLLDNNRVPSQFYLFQFTPSLSYNFKFL